MNEAEPHYVLLSQRMDDTHPGSWRFVLRTPDGSRRLEASDMEPEARGERLDLLTVVRGLEALEQPSRVVLVTSSVYVREGIRHGVSEWRHNGWRWERFGQMVPVKNADLWQRVDRAMQFHQIDCRMYRLDPPHQAGRGGPAAALGEDGRSAGSMTGPKRLQYRVVQFARWSGRWVVTRVRWAKHRLAQWWTTRNPSL